MDNKSNLKTEMSDEDSSASETNHQTHIQNLSITYRPSTHITSTLPSLTQTFPPNTNPNIKNEIIPPMLPMIATIAPIQINNDDNDYEAKLKRDAPKAGKPLDEHRRWFDAVYS